MQAKYENLPVYKKALDMAVYFEKVVRNFERYNKYTLGTELRNLARNILLLVAKANTRRSRKECLEQALDQLEQLRSVIHVCREVKAFNSINSVKVSIEFVVDISKQCEGWLGSLNSSKGYFEEVR